MNLLQSCNAKIKVAVSVDKQCTLIRIYMEKYISVGRYCKSTKFGVLLNLAFLALGQKLNRIIYEKTSIITQKVANPPNFIAAKYT